VNFEEFKQWWNEYQAEKTKERLIQEDPVRKYRYKQFMDAGPNEEGELARHKVAELMENLGRGISTAELDWLMVIVDQDHSDTVSFDEFEKCYGLLTAGDLSLDAFITALVPDDDDGSRLVPADILVSSVNRLCASEGLSAADNPSVQEFLAQHGTVGVGVEELKEWWGQFRLTAGLGDGSAPALGVAGVEGDAADELSGGLTLDELDELDELSGGGAKGGGGGCAAAWASRMACANALFILGGYAAERREPQVPCASRAPPACIAWLACEQRTTFHASRNGAKPGVYMSVVYFWYLAPHSHCANVHVRHCACCCKVNTHG
jgi:Ca2+-binding EF-hand superfamily protein